MSLTAANGLMIYFCRFLKDLRKQARQLENELDLKLVSFSKLCTSYSHSSARDGGRDRYSSDTTPLLNGSSQDRMFETMAIEIEQLLARVSAFGQTASLLFVRCGSALYCLLEHLLMLGVLLL